MRVTRRSSRAGLRKDAVAEAKHATTKHAATKDVKHKQKAVPKARKGRARSTNEVELDDQDDGREPDVMDASESVTGLPASASSAETAPPQADVDSDEEGEVKNTMTEYERQRQENMRRNLSIMKSLGISDNLSAISRAIVLETQPREGSRAAPRKRKVREDGDIRRSVRTRTMRMTSKDDNDEHRSLPPSPSSSRGSSPTRHSPGHFLPKRQNELEEGETVAYKAMLDWRNRTADEAGISRYMVVQKRSLCETVRLRPASLEELHVVWGLGQARIDKYGDTLLQLLSAHAAHLSSGPRPILDTQQGAGGVVITAEARSRTIDGEMAFKFVAHPRWLDCVVLKRRGQRGAVEEAAREGKALKSGDAWKRLDWNHLDRLQRDAGATVTLRHNARFVFRRTLNGPGDSLAEALQTLAHEGKKKANPKITGFIKVVENARLDDVPLPLLLEGALSSLRR